MDNLPPAPSIRRGLADALRWLAQRLDGREYVSLGMPRKHGVVVLDMRLVVESMADAQRQYNELVRRAAAASAQIDAE